MNKAVMLAAGLLVLASPALSQSSRPDDRDGRDSYDRHDSSRGSWGGDRGWREMARGGAGREMGEGGGHGGGARFMVRSGDARIAVKCDSSESMRACVDATLTLLDRVRAQSSGTGSGSTSGATSAPAAPTPR